MMSDVRSTRTLQDHVLHLADYETEVTKEDVTVLKDDWLTDGVCLDTLYTAIATLTRDCRSSPSGKSTLSLKAMQAADVH